MPVASGCWCVRSWTCVQVGKSLREDAMEEKPEQRDDAVGVRVAIGGLLLCLLVYGCWQAVAWFAASFPRDFR